MDEPLGEAMTAALSGASIIPLLQEIAALYEPGCQHQLALTEAIAACALADEYLVATVDWCKQQGRYAQRLDERMAELINVNRERNLLAAQLAACERGRTSDYDRMRAENSRLRTALERNLQGYRNLLEVRRIAYNRYGALTREEIEQEIGLIEAALAGEAKP